MNGKNKSVYYSSGDWTEKTSYYANGNYKSTSYGTNGAEKTSYNKNGYPVKHIGIISHYNSDHVLIKTENYTRSFSYTMDKKKKCPKEKLETESHPDGTTYQFKTVYTSFKKVSGARNCDASGNGVPFG